MAAAVSMVGVLSVLRPIDARKVAPSQKDRNRRMNAHGPGMALGEAYGSAGETGSM
jgi:hypothetical protein